MSVVQIIYHYPVGTVIVTATADVCRNVYSDKGMLSLSCWPSAYLSAGRRRTSLVPMELHTFWDMVHNSTNSHSHVQMFVNFTHPQSRRSRTSGVDACSSWPLSWNDISCQVAVSPKHRGRISQGKNLSLGDFWPTEQMYMALEEKKLFTYITVNTEMQAHCTEFI